ncbi:MAG: zf-TFIIB domain-containing protein [Leptolyngbyaceae cyanobacterium bins.59]|nr:zf-TFIIB domain-containing protein [Leptolyngbyaceae cyanobacterium bins.59]
MQCPKDKKVSLVDGLLASHLAVKCCPDCKGTWIPASEYEAWQTQQPQSVQASETFPDTLDVEYVQSPFDAKAALCPECNRYLSRARVSLKAPFYVERCLACGGIWCDHGEWDVLEKLGLHIAIQQLFSSEWQAKAREREYVLLERQATIEKLGPDLAARLFELAEVLQNHPNGDFGVAYLMRRFDKPQAIPPTNTP